MPASSLQTFTPISQDWGDKKKALLLVHGIGNSQRGEDQTIISALAQILGDKKDDYVIYQLHYDGINDWFREKTQANEQIEKATKFFKSKISDAELAATVAEYVGDVVWPILSQSARSALRTAYILQLQQLVLDGLNAGVQSRRQELSIIAHSLGCFHTYEALHAIANFKEHKLQPVSNGVRFRNVIYMASPVQLIRTVAGSLGPLVNKRWLASLSGTGLSQPAELVDGRNIKSVRNTIAIAGTMDPVGGFFLNNKADWAFMNLPGQTTIENPQMRGSQNITSLKQALALNNPGATSGTTDRPVFSATNPHDWRAYIGVNGPKLLDALA